jgi:hypothetical protein
MRVFTICLIALLSCDPKPPLTQQHKNMRVASANLFTGRYAQSRLAAWNLHANAIGSDCDVLMVKTSIILEESMVEAMHEGAGAYAVYDGGVQRFCRDHSFRAAAYKDRTGQIWAYGKVTATEAAAMKPCD